MDRIFIDCNLSYYLNNILYSSPGINIAEITKQITPIVTRISSFVNNINVVPTNKKNAIKSVSLAISFNE